MKKIINFFKQESASNKEDQQDDCERMTNHNNEKEDLEHNSDQQQQQEKFSTTTYLNKSKTTTTTNHFNEQLYVYSSANNNNIYKIQHHYKIVKITSMGTNICFANERNEIFKVNSNDGTCQQIFCNENLKNNPPMNIPIKYLLAGYFHLLVILENNLMYAHGNTDSNQVGPFNGKKIETLKLVDTTEIFKNRKDYNKDYNKDLKNDLKKDYNNYLEITHACSGTYSTIIVLNCNEIWYCGKIERNEKQYNFTKMKFTGGIVNNISCGYGHLLILNNKGELFGYGDNEYHQLFLEDTTSIKTLQKIKLTFLQKDSYILNAYAIRLSHLSVLITNLNEIYVFGYFGKDLGSSFTKLTTTMSGRIRLNQSVFQMSGNLKEINEATFFNYNDPIKNKEKNYKNYTYLNGEIDIYGGYSSLLIVDNLRKSIWLGGMRGQHFTNESFYIKEYLEEKNNDLLFLDAKEQVLDICCGSNCYGLLVGKVNLFNVYMLNNLKRLVERGCCDVVSLEENGDSITPLSDIDIKCVNLLSWQ